MKTNKFKSAKLMSVCLATLMTTAVISKASAESILAPAAVPEQKHLNSNPVPNMNKFYAHYCVNLGGEITESATFTLKHSRVACMRHPSDPHLVMITIPNKSKAGLYCADDQRHDIEVDEGFPCYMEDSKTKLEFSYKFIDSAESVSVTSNVTYKMSGGLRTTYITDWDKSKGIIVCSGKGVCGNSDPLEVYPGDDAYFIYQPF